jgi:hypothetical protein
LLVASATIAACQMPNPGFDGLADESETGDQRPTTGDPTEGSSTGDGDGDTSSSTGDGDGDGDPSTTGDGDGDGDANTCLPHQLMCGDACIDPLKDYDNCGDCGLSCGGGQICGLGECVAKRYVFVTSTSHTGDFGGLAGANEICNQRASQAQLPGSYRAWLSDGELSPAQVFEGGVAAFVLRNGPTLAYSLDDFMDGSLFAPINRDEFGGPIEASAWNGADCQVESAVWTGANDFGQFAGPACSSWGMISAELLGTVGDASATEQWSDAQCPAPCDQALPLYCVQE